MIVAVWQFVVKPLVGPLAELPMFGALFLARFLAWIGPPSAVFLKSCVESTRSICTLVGRMLPRLPQVQCAVGVGVDLGAAAGGVDSGGAGSEAGCGAGGGGKGAKWTSKDPYVADLANAIEQAHPNRIEGLGTFMMNVSANKLTDFDINGDVFVIEVFSGPGRDKVEQVTKISGLVMGEEGRALAVYAPDIDPATASAISSMGVSVFTGSVDEVVEWVGNQR